MPTDTYMPEWKGGIPENPFMNAQLEIKIDELLLPVVIEALERSGSGIVVSVSKRTLRRIQSTVWDGVPGISLLRSEQAVLVALEALGLTIREDDDDGAQ